MRYISIVSIVSVLLMLAACSSETTTVGPGDNVVSPDAPATSDSPSQPTSSTSTTGLSGLEPVTISDFTAVEEGEINRFYFQLQDKSGNTVASRGSVKLSIYDEAKTLLYENSFPVTVSDYEDYQFTLTGQDIGKAYEWRVPIDEIKKGVSSTEWGKSVLIFTTVGGKQLTAEDDSTSIPTYTDEELAAQSEAAYQKTAKIFNKELTKGNFKVTVLKGGFVDFYEYNEKKEYYRIDMTVQNIGSESEYFMPSALSIIDSASNQYDAAYGGTLDTSKNMMPGTKQTGYAFFEGVPKTVVSAKMVFELGNDENYDSYVFEYQLS